MIISREALTRIQQAFRINPVVGLLGPRQVGKSTLAKQYIQQNTKKESVLYFDLEDPRDQERLNNPILALDGTKEFIVIDEIQKAPRLFEYLRVLVDQKKRKIKVLVLGSASHDLTQQSSESLAGRISYVELYPFNIVEVNETEKLHLRGGMPLSFLATSEKKSFEWRRSYINTFLERDLFDFGYRIAPSTIRRFWMMLSHYHGQILNLSELGRSFGVSDMTVRKYLELLSETFMIRLLQPWYENVSKRQVKAPKLYLRDSGILHALFGFENKNTLMNHPKLGASWEGFAMEQTINCLGLRSEEVFFWSTHNQTELDLLTFQKDKRIGYEFKYQDAPKLQPSMKIAIQDLKLDKLVVVTPKGQSYALDKKIYAYSLEELLLC